MSFTRLVFRYRLVSWLLIVSLILCGIASYQLINRREDPDVPARNGQIVVLYPGATTEQVEQLIVDPLEQTLLDLDKVQKVESRSRPGVAIVKVMVRDDVSNIPPFWTEVRHRVSDVQPKFPAGVASVQVNDHFGDTSALIYGVVWPGATDRQREDIARRGRDQMRRLKEVAEVQMLGLRQERIEIAVHPDRMAEQGIGPNILVQSLTGRNVLSEAGSLQQSEFQPRVSTSGEIRQWTDLRRILVGNTNTRIEDIADVTRLIQDPADSYVRVNGQPSVILSMTMRKGEDILKMGRKVENSIEELRKQLPPGCTIVKVNDLPSSVINRISEFNNNLRDGVILILATTFLFMGLRSAALVGALLPVTILGTYAAMIVCGRDLQQMSITALIIALGLVVDNSVVVVDNIEHHLAQGMERTEAAIVGAGELQIPLLTSNLTTVAAFLPLALLGGGKGDFIRDLALVTSMATLVSLVLNLSLMPLLCERFLRAVEPNRFQKVFFRLVDFLRESIMGVSERSLRSPRRTVILAVLSIGVATAIVPLLGVQFFPSAQRSQFTVEIWCRDGSSIEKTSAITSRVEAYLKPLPEVVSTIAYVGRGGPRFYYNTDPEPPWPSYAQIVVNTKSVAATEEIMPRLRRELGPLCPEARVVPRKLEQGPPVGAPVHLRLKAEDYTALRIKADEIIQKLALQPGIFQAYHDMGELAPSLNLKLDQEKMAEVGLSNAQISQISQLGLAGITATYIREGDRNIPVDLRLPAPLRSSPQALLDLPLINSSGDWIPVSQIAQLEWIGKALRLSHHQRERTVNIYGHTDGTRLASRILADVLPGFQNLPPGMQLTYGGEQEEVDKSFRELALVFFVTVVGQMLIVAAQFNDARITATILSTIPLSMFGAMSGLLITHQVFGFTAFLGIITLGGVVTNHAIMFFEYTRREQSEGQEAMLSAGRKRIRPILLTVLLSIGGLLPLGWGGGNLWPPMAWSLVFGLIYSLPLALIIVPSVYASLSSLSWASLPKFKRAAPLVLIALSMQLCPLPVRAEETPALTISLNQALETALKSHPRVQEFEARWKESQAQRDEAAAPGRPRLNLRAGSNYFSPSQTLNFGPNQINVAVNQNWNSGVSLEYSLFTFGRLEWSGLAAEQREQMAIYEYQLSRQRAWEEITLIYLDLMERQEKLQVATRSHLVRQQALKDTQAQVKAGVSPKFELLRAQAEEQQALQAVFQARGEQVAARSRLGSLLGLPSTANWALDNALPKIEPLETKGALERALIGRPDLLAMGRAVEAAVARVGFEDSQNSPNLGLQIDYLRQNPTAFRLGEQFSAGVVLQIPLYDGGLSSAKVSAAQQRVQQLKSQQQQLERDVRVEIETLAAALETSEQQWKAAQLQLSAATEAERVARLRYQNGLGTQLERMDAERQRLAAEEAQLSAQFRLHANWTRWRRATASLTPAELLENPL